MLRRRLAGRRGHRGRGHYRHTLVPLPRLLPSTHTSRRAAVGSAQGARGRVRRRHAHLRGVERWHGQLPRLPWMHTQSDTHPDNQPSKQPINDHDRQPAGLWWSAMNGHQGICNSLLHLAARHKQSALPYMEMRFLKTDRQNPRGIPHWGLLFDAAATSTQRNGGPLLSMILRLCTTLSCSHRASRLCTSRSWLLIQDYSRAE